MTEQQIRLQRASIEWILKNGNSFTHAVTLTLKPCISTLNERGTSFQRLTDIDAKRNFALFLKRLNYSIYGNASKRFGKKVIAMPTLEGHGKDKLLHYHCALGGFRADLSEDAIAAKITAAWQQTQFGNEQVKVVKLQTNGWHTYIGKEIGLLNADVLDWENIHLPTALLT